jgi:hypothetical protein
MTAWPFEDRLPADAAMRSTMPMNEITAPARYGAPSRTRNQESLEDV